MLAETIVKGKTAETLDGKGKPVEKSALSSIFDHMEQGLTIEDAVKEVSQVAPEGQPEVKAEVKPGVKDEVKDEVKPEAKDEVTEEELVVLPHDKPKTAKRIQALLKRIDETKKLAEETKKEVDAKATKMAELETQLATAKTVDPRTTEEVKKQLDELAMYRRQYALEQDPEVKSRYDDRITSAEKPIADILARHGAGEALLKTIQEEGGWLKFAQSGRQIQLKDEARPASEVAELILENIPFGDRKTVEALAMEQITTKREKERFFEEQKKTATDYFKRLEEEQKKGTVEQQKMSEEMKKMIDGFYTKNTSETEWLKEAQLPADATAEKKAEVEEHNTHVKSLHSTFKKALETKDLPGMLQVVRDAVELQNEKRLRAKAVSALDIERERVKKLQADLDRYKKGSRSVPAAGSITQRSSSGETEKVKPVGIGAAFDAIAAGHDLE